MKSPRQIFLRINLLAAAVFITCALASANAPVRPDPTPQPTVENETPILLQHLPNWESVAKQATYVVTLDGLKAVVANQPIIDAINFEGGTEAVAANYGKSQLLIVEFATPQFSVENDQLIAAKIQELKSQSRETIHN